MSNKLIRSTRTLNEHVDNLLIVREAKDIGKSDRQICRDLGISFSTLKKYKELLASTDLETLTPEYQNEKRCELDSQVQSVVNKLYNVTQTIEDNYKKQKEEIEEHLETKGENLEYKEKMQLKRQIQYPNERIVSIQRLLLNAIELRSRIWGLDKENQGGIQIQSNKKIVFESTQHVKTNTDKINEIADSIVGNKTDGLQL